MKLVKNESDIRQGKKVSDKEAEEAVIKLLKQAKLLTNKLNKLSKLF